MSWNSIISIFPHAIPVRSAYRLEINVFSEASVGAAVCIGRFGSFIDVDAAWTTNGVVPARSHAVENIDTGPGTLSKNQDQT